MNRLFAKVGNWELGWQRIMQADLTDWLSVGNGKLAIDFQEKVRKKDFT